MTAIAHGPNLQKLLTQSYKKMKENQICEHLKTKKWDRNKKHIKTYALTRLLT